jgi:hypothetical protein
MREGKKLKPNFVPSACVLQQRVFNFIEEDEKYGGIIMKSNLG